MEQGILMGTVPLFFSESKEIKLEKTPRINRSAFPSFDFLDEVVNVINNYSDNCVCDLAPE